MTKTSESVRGYRIAAALAVALFVGVVARQWAYDHTEPMRREVTQRNAFYWGDRLVRGARAEPGASARGAAGWGAIWKSYVAIYDAEEARGSVDHEHVLDYVPLRLLMAGVWVNWLNLHYGPVSEWRPEFARSFAAFSMVMELLGAVAMFALVVRWLGRRGAEETSAGPLGWGRWELAAAAAIALWLNPASIIDSHVWPHGETWVTPFCLFAVLAMVERRYLMAGAIFGLGAMFKGQMMIVALGLVLWPMFDRRWTGAVQVVLGMGLAMAFVAAPWLIRGTMAWARAGFAAHVDFDDVLTKEHALNLSSLLSHFGHVRLHQVLIDLHSIGVPVAIDVKTVLVMAYAVLLVWSAWGMAQLGRSGDRRLLVAIAAPWGLMFFLLGQMDERYLMWAACLSAGAVAVGGRGLAAHVMLTWCAAVGDCEAMLFDKPGVHPTLLHWLHVMTPVTFGLTAVGVGILFLESVGKMPRIGGFGGPVSKRQASYAMTGADSL